MYITLRFYQVNEILMKIPYLNQIYTPRRTQQIQTCVRYEYREIRTEK